eukprot:COSAG01_NODE_26135_length_722_cov_4.340289_2_plen_79_part_00
MWWLVGGGGDWGGGGGGGGGGIRVIRKKVESVGWHAVLLDLVQYVRWHPTPSRARLTQLVRFLCRGELARQQQLAIDK